MNKLLAIVPVLAVLSGCSTFSSNDDYYGDRSARVYERESRFVENTIDEAPNWMIEIPRSDSAIFENGTSVSRDYSMSVNKAKTLAFGKLCVAFGGTTDQQSKIYQRDTENSSSETSELAIRTRCKGVDMSGAEVADIKTVPQGNRFRTYVLIALPFGDANGIVKERERREEKAHSLKRSEDAFKELDRIPNTTQPAIPQVNVAPVTSGGLVLTKPI